MKRIWSMSFLVLSWIAWPQIGYSHGAHAELVRGCSVVRALYDNGGPMAYCDAFVFEPGSAKDPSLQGSTDRDGCFAFVPSVEGQWTVVIDDGMGHETTVAVMATSEGITVDNGRPAVDRLSGGIVGVSIIFGLFGLYSLVRSRRR